MNFHNKSIVFLAGIFLVALVISGCESYKEVYIRSGLWGEHELCHHERADYGAFKIGGGFFLGCGGIDGSLESVSEVRFFWKLNTEEKPIFNTVCELEKIVIMVDNAKKTPTVEFLFRNAQYSSDYGDGYAYRIDQVSDTVKSGITGLVLRISEEDLKNEIYLPKIK